MPPVSQITINTAVLPVAGLGTRLLPLSAAVPKEMLPVGRLPAIHRIVEELLAWNIDRQLLVVRKGKISIADYLEESPEFKGRGRFAYVFQHDLRGLGHAVLQAEGWVGDGPFLVALGDAVMNSHALLGRMLAAFREETVSAVVAFEEVSRDNVFRYGIADPRGNGDVFELAGVVEKPSPESAPSNLAISARYLLTPAIFEELSAASPGHGGEIQLTDAIHRLIQKGRRALGVRLLPDERRYDIGSFESFRKAFDDFAEREGQS
ncbi:MAG: NTP transferase domain-containing protein [Armatimonadetes bacterium]|nr:NTP transferase domain-containing protein [Armatimonadota bacterium]